MKVKLNKLLNRRLVAFYKSGITSMRLKYFIQFNQLYLLDDSEGSISLSSEVKYKYYTNEVGDKVLKLVFMKTGARLIDDKIAELSGQLETLFNGDLLDLINTRNTVEFQLIVKESEQEEYVIPYELERDDSLEGYIRLSKYYSWNYRKDAHLLIGGNTGTGKSYLLYQLITETIKQTEKEEIYICDGKNDELSLHAEKIFHLKHILKSSKSILETVKTVVKEMDRRFSLRQDKGYNVEFFPIFLFIDEYTSLKLVMNKKEYQELEQSIKQLVLKARSANIHLIIALQRASSTNMDLDLRDNCSIKIGLGNLSVENYKMLFNENIEKSALKQKDIGQGYIYQQGVIKNFKAFNIKV